MDSGLMKNMNDNKVNQESFSELINIIHEFSQDIISAKTESEVFRILVSEVAKQLSFLDCAIYKVNNQKKLLYQVAAYSPSNNPSKSVADELEPHLELKFGQGHEGVVAESGKALKIDDVTKSEDYFLDVVQAGSELVVPVKINNVVYAVITSEHPEKNFYKAVHKKMLEVVASIAVGALVKIHENEELALIKGKLELVLEKKNADLDMAIETLSSQYSKLKHQHEKQETLIQEVHHRVTNNLQIISSILRLYINEDKYKDSTSLQEVHNRIQAMALIHQNIYKSIEVNLVNINTYFYDLINYLKSTSPGLRVGFDINVEFEHFGIDVLVPLGLYITEIYYYLLGKYTDKKEINLRLDLTEEKEDFSFCIKIKDNDEVAFQEIIELDKSKDVSSILISALIDQLEGELTQSFNSGNILDLKFKAIS